MAEKTIELCKVKISDLKNDFGNPRKKLNEEDIESLKQSISELKDFGVVVIDENNNVISGSQRIEAMKELGVKTPIDCKRLIGYTESEKKAINIRANVNSGEFDDTLLMEFIIDMPELDMDLSGFDFQIDETELLETKKENLTPYQKHHILISIDISDLHNHIELLNRIKKEPGIEIEEGSN